MEFTFVYIALWRHDMEIITTLMFSFVLTWTSCRTHSPDAGNFRRYDTHYDVLVMEKKVHVNLVCILMAWFGWLVGWLIDWLVGWLVGWLIGWRRLNRYSLIYLYMYIKNDRPFRDCDDKYILHVKYMYCFNLFSKFCTSLQYSLWCRMWNFHGLLCYHVSYIHFGVRFSFEIHWI